jgi:hypothetical protein
MKFMSTPNFMASPGQERSYRKPGCGVPWSAGTATRLSVGKQAAELNAGKPWAPFKPLKVLSTPYW